MPPLWQFTDDAGRRFIHPFGNNVQRSGALRCTVVISFVELINEASDLNNDTAFALGALAHYSADNLGHPTTVNRAVAPGVFKTAEEVRQQGHLCG